MVEVLNELKKEQIEFICKECGITEEQLFAMDEDTLYDSVYDVMCDIECAETPDGNEPLSEHCAMASELVTILGNTIPADESEFDGEYFDGMRVKYIGEDDPEQLLNGKEYDVVELDYHTGWYRITNETGDDYLFPPEDFEVLRDDGGPGSGNHGHKGVPGQVGGSAPAGKNPMTARGPIKERLKELGHSQESIDRAALLFDVHSGNSRSAQANADAEIAKHITDNDEIGAMLKDKAEMEAQCWRDQIADSNIKAKQDYEEQIEDIRKMIAPGGPLQNYTEDDLKDLGLWPKEPKPVELKFYRKGGMDGAVLAFTTNPDGANMSYLTEGENGSIGSDHEFTLEQMKVMGYLPIAGIQSMDIGQVGESEVLFAKFPEESGSVKQDV